MSGDVQPRKRKDKKRKKDDLGVEEPRGTAAVLGEGDVFMHSQHEHGTGGHWCAKIIFFSLLGVLITLIGLIILENRGLTELEANSVESRYSGVLEGWLEDAPDDAHHDEHTLELLKQHDEQDMQIESQEDDHDDENYEINENDSANEDIEESEEEDVDEDEQETSNEDVLQQSNEDDDDDYDNDDENKNGDDEKSEERILEDTEEADDEDIETGDNNEEDNERGDDDENTERDDDDEDKARGDDDDNNSNVNDEIYEDDDQNNDDQNVERQKLNEEDSSEHFENDQSDENMNNEFGNNENNNVGSNHELDSEENSHGEDFEEHEYHDEEENKDVAIELEKLEKEVLDEDQPSQEIEDEKSEEITKQLSNEDDSDDVDSIEDEEFLEVDDVDEPLPIVERIVVPKGKPLAEVEDEPTTIKPTDTLAEEEEYERQQEELRKEQAQASHEDGGNSIEDDWPGEPDEKYWRQQINEAEQALDQGEWSAAIERVSAEKLKGSARARWVLARAIDASAEAKRDNRLLTRAITAYLDVLKMNERLSDNRLTEIAERTLARIRFRGNYLSAEPVYRLLIRRFPDVVDHRNNLTVSLLMANRADLAEEIIKETLQKWPNDRIALAHLGFILKTQHNRLEEAVDAFHKALEGDIGSATEPRFYYHLGDAYLLLGRFAEAHEVHKRGAKLGHFLSPAQRSLYNVNRLKSRPWWNIEQTPYMKLARALEKSWKDILKEGQAAQALYEKEKEGLKERGEWSQLDLFIRGQEVPGRCKKAPVTCSVVRSEAAAVGCRRGQIKFSSMEAGTHVRPHVGPTNCRLRMHLGLSNTKDTYIRVDQETRQWQVGKVFMFDDSFEHEVWHNGTGTRLVLIVDVWHPDLSVAERRSLAPI